MTRVPAIRVKGFTDEWNQRKLSDVCGPFEYGLNAAAKEYDGENKYIRITDIDDSSREFSYKMLASPDVCLDGMDKYLLSNGDVVFARTGASVGKTYAYREKDGIVYFAGFLIRTKVTQQNDVEFVFQSTLTPRYEKYIRIASQRSGQPGVNSQEYGEYEFFVPAKEEQMWIGKLFREMDTFIALQQKKLDKLVLAKKAMLSKMFPQNGAKTPEVRFKRFSGVWTECKFGELYQKISEKNDLSYGTDRIISVANMYFKDDVHISDADYLKTYNVFKVGDIAFEGNKSKNFAHGRFVENTIGDGIVSHVFEVFRPRMLEYDLQFWKIAINSEELMGKVLLRCTKSSTMMTTLVAEDFYEETFLVPEVAEQKKIGAFFASLDNLISRQEAKIEKLKKTKKALLSRMFV